MRVCQMHKGADKGRRYAYGQKRQASLTFCSNWRMHCWSKVVETCNKERLRNDCTPAEQTQGCIQLTERDSREVNEMETRGPPSVLV